MHPLPRSLEPITGESLVSYLLRLAHRLSLPPLHLARMAGWATGLHHNHLTHKLLLDIAQPHADAFARLTRLTTQEVTALTLSSWQDRYLPISRSMPQRAPSGQDAWLFISSPRFCPSCLAGDGSAAQQLHAGPWRKLWHLPVVFACLEHQEFLEPACPHCGHFSDGREPLIRRANDHSLHPAQCRWTTFDTQARKPKAQACGAWLDQATAPNGSRAQPTADLLQLQRSILTRLAPSTPATEAAEYLTDLRLVATLISTSWPHGRHLVDTDSAEKIAAHVHNLHASTDGLQHRRVRDAPPRDPIACAGLLRAAEHLLADDDLPNALSQLIQSGFRGRPSRTPWARVLARHQDGCSERLREAAEPVTRAFRRIGGCRGTRAPAHDDYRPEHIPAFLEPDWYQRHLARFSGMAPKIVRRSAAVRLVQWAMGGSQGDAATFLGINPERLQFKATSGVRAWARAGHDPIEFDTALRNLATELRTPRQPLIDYRRRREALQDWVLAPDTWNALVNELPPTPGPVRPVVDDRKRQEASVFVWVQVTRGEHLFAPRPIEAEQPQHVQQEWARRRNTTWYQLTRPDPLRHYADLRKALTEHARQLTRDVDTRATPAQEAPCRATSAAQPGQHKR
jgi:hypothetical protein